MVWKTSDFVVLCLTHLKTINHYLPYYAWPLAACWVLVAINTLLLHRNTSLVENSGYVAEKKLVHKYVNVAK